MRVQSGVYGCALIRHNGLHSSTIRFRPTGQRSKSRTAMHDTIRMEQNPSSGGSFPFHIARGWPRGAVDLDRRSPERVCRRPRAPSAEPGVSSRAAGGSPPVHNDPGGLPARPVLSSFVSRPPAAATPAPHLLGCAVVSIHNAASGPPSVTQISIRSNDQVERIFDCILHPPLCSHRQRRRLWRARGNAIGAGRGVAPLLFFLLQKHL